MSAEDFILEVERCVAERDRWGLRCLQDACGENRTRKNILRCADNLVVSIIDKNLVVSSHSYSHMVHGFHELRAADPRESV